MSYSTEKILIATKHRRDKFDCVEYRIKLQICIGFQNGTEPPDTFIAHMLANKLREYVNSAVLVPDVEEVVKHDMPYSCPTCGRDLVADEGMKARDSKEDK